MNDQTALMPALPRSGELATAAAAALAKATIEAKFVIALKNTRKPMEARDRILEACKRPGFAKAAIYAKPVGGQKIRGLSIRFAETAIQAWKNVDVTAPVVFEDEDKRLVRITVTDLESNISYSDDVILDKTVERRSPDKTREVIRERLNKQGEKVFVVSATEDELMNKLNAAKSKTIRNSGLRLIPSDFLEEATEAIYETLAGKGGDPRQQIKDIADGFSSLGIRPTELEKYLTHSLDSVTPAEVVDLRAVYAAVKDGEAKWADYVKTEPDRPAFDDQVPGAEVPPKKKANVKRPTLVEAPLTPQETLEQLVTSNGHTFVKLVKWGTETGMIPDADSYPNFADIPGSVCTKLINAQAGLLRGLAQTK